MEFESENTANTANTVQNNVPVAQNATGQSGQFFVKSLTGDTITIDYNSSMLVSEVKDYINSEKQIPVAQQRLVFQGKQLDDANTIDDYGITAQSTIHLVLSVKGGH